MAGRRDRSSRRRSCSGRTSPTSANASCGRATNCTHTVHTRRSRRTNRSTDPNSCPSSDPSSRHGSRNSCASHDTRGPSHRTCSSRCRRRSRGRAPARTPTLRRVNSIHRRPRNRSRPPRRGSTGPPPARPPAPPPPSPSMSLAPWYARCPPWLSLPAPWCRAGPVPTGCYASNAMHPNDLWGLRPAACCGAPVRGQGHTPHLRGDRRLAPWERPGKPSAPRALLDGRERRTFLRPADACRRHRRGLLARRRRPSRERRVRGSFTGRVEGLRDFDGRRTRRNGLERRGTDRITATVRRWQGRSRTARKAPPSPRTSPP